LEIFFLSKTPIAQEIRARTSKCDCIKSKSFCTLEETISRLKRQSTKWEKIIASYLITRVYKELKKTKKKSIRTNNSIDK
jgi:hypothetical protein